MVKMRKIVLRARVVAERCMVRVALDVRRLDRRRVTLRLASGSCGCSAFATRMCVFSVEKGLNVSGFELNEGDSLGSVVAVKKKGLPRFSVSCLSTLFASRVTRAYATKESGEVSSFASARRDLSCCSRAAMESCSGAGCGGFGRGCREGGDVVFCNAESRLVPWRSMRYRAT